MEFSGLPVISNVLSGLNKDEFLKASALFEKHLIN